MEQRLKSKQPLAWLKEQEAIPYTSPEVHLGMHHHYVIRRQMPGTSFACAGYGYRFQVGSTFKAVSNGQIWGFLYI
jgi:hypothetical protein